MTLGTALFGPHLPGGDVLLAWHGVDGSFVLILTTDDARRLLRDEDLRTIRTTFDFWDSYNIGTDLGRDIEFQAALVDSVRSVDTEDKEDIVKLRLR